MKWLILKIIEYKILFTSDSTFWLSCDDKTSKNLRFLSDLNLLMSITLIKRPFVDPIVYKIISGYAHPTLHFLIGNIGK